MSEIPWGERMDVRVEVEGGDVVVVFPRPMESFACPWQEAWNLGETLELASSDADRLLVIDGVRVKAETEQVRIGTHKDELVVLLWRWSDRLRFSAEAAKIVGRAVKVKAQDCQLYREKLVKMHYNRYGSPRPECLPSKRTVFGPNGR